MTDDALDPRPEPAARLRRSIYLILIAVGAGIMLGRILAVDSVDMLKVYNTRLADSAKRLAKKRADLIAKGVSGPKLEEALKEYGEKLDKWTQVMRPFLSANDRSRWCVVRALVEPKMRVYEEVQEDGQTVRRLVPYAIDKVIQEPGWDTIDMVKHDEAGRGGMAADEGHCYSSKPPLLPTLVAGPYWLIYKLTGKTLGDEPYAIGRGLLVAINLVPLVIAFLLLGRLVERFGASDWGRMFVMAGAVFGTFLTTFAVTLNNHVPAAVSALAALAAAIPIWFDGRRRWWYFALAGFFAAFTATNELPAASFFALLTAGLLWKAPRRTLLVYVPASLVVAAAFFGTNWIAHHDLSPPYSHRDASNPANNWYDYSYMRGTREIPSYWRSRVGIDQIEKSRAVYSFNCLVGHHGIFSLTPMWLLTVVGLGMWLIRPPDARLRTLAVLISVLSLVCLVFYLLIVGERNYGGMTSGLRWMFWFAPMWLLAMLPAVDWMSRHRWARGLALVLLCISALSAAYPTWNPWTHPWIYHWFKYAGWM